MHLLWQHIVMKDENSLIEGNHSSENPWISDGVIKQSILQLFLLLKILCLYSECGIQAKQAIGYPYNAFLLHLLMVYLGLAILYLQMVLPYVHENMQNGPHKYVSAYLTITLSFEAHLHCNSHMNTRSDSVWRVSIGQFPYSAGFFSYFYLKSTTKNI